MRRAGDGFEPGAADRGGNVRGDALHVRDVLVPHDHERRAAHVAEPFVDRRLEDCFLLRLLGTLELVRTKHHLAHARTELLVDLVRRAARPVDPLPQARLGRPLEVAALERLFLGGPAGSRLIRPGPAGEPRCDEHEPLDEVGPEHRELERHATAERGADDDRRAVEQCLGVTCVGERLRPHRALPEPAQIGRKHVESGSTKRRLLRAPHAAVGDAGVQQQCSGQVVLRIDGRNPFDTLPAVPVPHNAPARVPRRSIGAPDR